MVKVYGSETCGNCKVLLKKLESKKIEFEYITDVEELRKNNIIGLPTIIIDGNTYNYYQAIQYINGI